MPAKKKRETRSPLRQASLPQAGDSTIGRARDIFDGPVLGWVMTTACLAGLTWVQFIAWSSKEPIHPGHFAVMTVVVGVFGEFRIRSHIKRACNYVLGAEGERAVGQLLGQTREKGYRVYHDIKGDGFNIDHVLIGPGGVFVIETKTASKPTNGNAKIKYDGETVRIGAHIPDRNPVEQAKARSYGQGSSQSD